MVRDPLGAVTSVRLFLAATEVELAPATGAVIRAFAYLSMGTPVAKIVAPAGGWSTASTNMAAVQAASSLELQHHGLANSTLLSIQPDATAQAGFVYGPYGEVIESAGTSAGLIDQRRRFNDKQTDDQTGLHYYGVRYFDDVMLGWTQADPLYRFVPDAAWESPRKANLYQFVLANPLRYLDPDGRQVHPQQFYGGLGAAGQKASGLVSSVVSHVRSAADTAVTVAAFVPGLDTVADVIDVASKLAQGDYKGAATAAVMAVAPGISARAVKTVGKVAVGLVRHADDVTDAAKAVDRGEGVAHGATRTSPTAGKRVDSKTRDRILARDQKPDGSWDCATCGQNTRNPDNIHTGHIEPRSKGGDLSDGNLRCEGAACNLSQGDRAVPSPGGTCKERGSCGAPYGRMD